MHVSREFTCTTDQRELAGRAEVAQRKRKEREREKDRGERERERVKEREMQATTG